ncbi:hypothetical protein K432DRAFT_232931 [Lepidopterella palustris CBS 459.81]|uniref:Uncharacterized protein n=1 Tax=Lepidopterella palustris CBS 459.81 TaxID=1314670 RepID=A0A8E2EEI7_9PEZI|nr:hypothetical protein K432DRAFT_232931 [Lepidopterella palustris CBS 459.81]
MGYILLCRWRASIGTCHGHWLGLASPPTTNFVGIRSASPAPKISVVQRDGGIMLAWLVRVTLSGVKVVNSWHIQTSNRTDGRAFLPLHRTWRTEEHEGIPHFASGHWKLSSIYLRETGGRTPFDEANPRLLSLETVSSSKCRQSSCSQPLSILPSSFGLSTHLKSSSEDGIGLDIDLQGTALAFANSRLSEGSIYRMEMVTQKDIRPACDPLTENFSPSYCTGSFGFVRLHQPFTDCTGRVPMLVVFL